MKRRLSLTLLTLVLVASFASLSADAYELATHGALTEKAYELSVLTTDPQLLKSLGIDTSKTNVFGEAYYDVSGNDVRERTQNDFEKDKMPNRGRDFLTVKGWLMRGAIREDDYTGRTAPNPQDDNLDRPLNHFYDPVKDRALTVLLMEIGKKAPDWALGAQDAFAQALVPQPNRRNHFTLFDAYEAMYRALTGRDSAGKEVAKTQEERNKYWATTFRALGDVVHLIQDMAQPQHTRNDPHAGIRFLEPIAGHKSIYEDYIEARAKGDKLSTLDGQVVPLAALLYTGYPIPRFTKASDFFSTRTGLAGKGLADYSNRGFISAGTNLGSNPYTSPSNDPNAYTREILTISGDLTVTLLKGSVPDTLTGVPATDVALTTESLWYDYLTDPDYTVVAQVTKYSLNQHNYDAMAALLIPRAVAYSAGFIDYFFRGRLEIDNVSDTDTELLIQVRNVSGEKNPLKNGTFTLYYDALDGTRKRLDITQNATISVLPHDGYLVLTAQKPKLSEVDLNKENPLTLVFKGTIGEEEAVAGVVLERPLSGFIVTPNYTPADGVSGPRHIYFEGGQWKLNPRAGLVAGNIDWKGWYVNGRPTKVLTGWGPHRRYALSGGGVFHDEIYLNGRLFARAPGAVLGAALARNAAGRAWLIAVCAEGETEVVYRRPAKRSDSAERFDPISHPDGWEEIGRFNGPRVTFLAPWFFNGTGTEAQTVRLGSNLVPGAGSRHRLTIEPGSLNTAQFETLENAAGWRGERHNSGIDSDIVLPPEEWHCRSYRTHTIQSTS